MPGPVPAARRLRPSAEGGKAGRAGCEPRIRQGALHQVRIPHPDARRREALHRRLRPEGRRRRPTRSCSTRTPYSVAPYGVDQYQDDLGPSPLFGKAGYIFVYQDVRGRWMSEGEFVNMRPHNADKNGPKDIDESTDTYDTIDWLRQERAEQQRQGRACGASRTPASTPSAGMIDAHPALKAASPQAPVTDWFIGDDWHHNGALFLPHCFNFMADFGQPAARADQEVPTCRSSTARPTATSSSSTGAARQRRREVLQGRRRVLERGDGARHLRRVLEGAQPPAAPEEHQAGGADRRRLVRRREPVRRAGDVSRAIESEQPERRQHPGDGPVGPRRLEPRRRRHARRRARSTPRPASSTARRSSSRSSSTT